MLDTQEAQQIAESAARMIFINELSPRRVIGTLATQFPQASAKLIGFVMMDVVNAHYETFEVPETDETRIPARTDRAVAMLLGDLYALETMGRHAVTGADLLQFWGENDQFFLSD